MGSTEELALLDSDRSNKGASKQRRDQINAEISVMRDLLPLPESSRQRLSQLQIMSLTCVYIRKCNVLQTLFRSTAHEPELPDSVDFCQAMSGFLLVTTREGKLVYISENVTDYLGHSMVDMKTQGDSLYDIVDKRDHSTLQEQLLQGGTQQDQDSDRVISFLCRMNMSRTLKRQPGFGDCKVMHVRGHFRNMSSIESGCPNDSQCVFMATCSPLINPDIKENIVQNNTMVFKTVHKLDMSFLGLSKNGEYHLGCTNDNLYQRSWYSVLHPEDILEAKDKHTQLIRSNHETGCMLTVRMLKMDGTSFWVSIVMQIHQACPSQNDEPLIVCINQVIDAQDAYQIKTQGNIFSMYSSCSHDMMRSPPTASCSPVQNNISSQCYPSHIPNAVPISEQRANIPSYIKHAGIQDIFLNKCSSTANFNIKSESDYPQQDQSSFVPPDQLKAMLKRKIHSNSCLPIKLAKLSWDADDTNRATDHPVMVNGMPQNERYTHSSDFSYAEGQSQRMQDLQPSNQATGVMTTVKMPLKQLTRQNVSKVNYMSTEQIVPESYLTPDPSPIPSPQSSHLSMKAEVSSCKENAAKGKSVSILDALEKLVNPSETRDKAPFGKREKELPILDVNYIENYFDVLNGKEWNTAVKIEEPMKYEMMRESPTEQNIPNFAALKDERLSFSPCLPNNDQSVGISNMRPSSQSLMQPKFKSVSKFQIRSQMQPSSLSQIHSVSKPQVQAQSMPVIHSSTKTNVKPQINPSFPPQVHSQRQPLIQPQVQSQASSSNLPQVQPKIYSSQFQIQSHPLTQIQTQPKINPSIQNQGQPQMNHFSHPQIKSPVSYPYIPKCQEALNTSYIHMNTFEPCSNTYDYSNGMFLPSTSVTSPESVASQEAIDDFLSCISDDSLDQTQSDSISSTCDDMDINSEISFYMENSDGHKVSQLKTQGTLELSPLSSSSSLDDDLLDNPKLASGMMHNEIVAPCQMFSASSFGIQKQDDLALGMSSDLEWDFLLNSLELTQGSFDLNMMKHSQ